MLAPPPLPPNVVARAGKARVCGGLECRTKLELRRSVSVRGVRSGEALQGGTCARCGRLGGRAAARGVLATSRNAQVREAGAGTAIANCVDLHSGITDMHTYRVASPSSSRPVPRPRRARSGSRTSASPRGADRGTRGCLRAPSSVAPARLDSCLVGGTWSCGCSRGCTVMHARRFAGSRLRVGSLLVASAGWAWGLGWVDRTSRRPVLSS